MTFVDEAAELRNRLQEANKQIVQVIEEKATLQSRVRNAAEYCNLIAGDHDGTAKEKEVVKMILHYLED